MIFLMETKCAKEKMEEVKRKLKFDYCFVVDSLRSSEGLAFLWKHEVEIELINFSRWHINVIVIDRSKELSCQFTGFYGYPEISKRESSWNLLRLLKLEETIPWICVGDFNEIINLNEKFGVARSLFKQMQAFKDALGSCSRNVVCIKGPKYTWFNNTRAHDFIKERLDRVVANPVWHQVINDGSCLFCLPRDKIIVPYFSRDHKHKLVDRKESQFSYMKLLDDAWNRPAIQEDESPAIKRKLPTCKEVLQRQNINVVRRDQEAVQGKFKRLGYLQEKGNGGKIKEIQQLQKELDKNLEETDLKWKQRAKKKWLHYGDKNTKYYHMYATQRRKINKIAKILDDQGNIITDQECIGSIFIGYFAELFTSSSPYTFIECMFGIYHCVIDEMNKNILQEFTELEVKEAVFQMSSLSSKVQIVPSSFLTEKLAHSWKGSLQVCIEYSQL